MRERHPYVPAPGGLIKVINHFRKSFPQTVNAATIKKLGYATKNEAYVMNVLRFLGLIDETGAKIEAAGKVFNMHDGPSFQKAFGSLVETAYDSLFTLHGADAWNLDQNTLITFFRGNDDTTALVGTRQAATFRTLAALAGKGELPASKSSSSSKAPTSQPKGKPAKPIKPSLIPAPAHVPPLVKPVVPDGKSIGLTVRVEINLPADGDQATYDKIFKSIRENLLNV